MYEKPALAGALGSLTGKNLGEDPKAWMKWYRNEQRAKLERRKAEREADS